MFKFNNSHIFTGYLKQLLSSVNLPTCRIYTQEFAKYFDRTGKEDPRVIESFDTLTYTGDVTKYRAATRVNYLKANELFNYFWNYSQASINSTASDAYWKRTSSIFYNSDKRIPGLTRVLNSPGSVYDTCTHEYLGEYLRFMRDYYNINLMSLYNCFNNKICSNIYYKHVVKDSIRVFDSQDSNYRIYAFPAKLFSNYTIAIDCDQVIEMFCGLYTDTLETTYRGKDLITKTYRKINKSIFKQPFVYDALDVKYWNFKEDTSLIEVPKDSTKYPKFVIENHITRWDIANREQDLKLFIKIPTSCRSSIVVLEGDFRTYNDVKYTLTKVTKQGNNGTTEDTVWEYKQNHSVLNFKSGLDTNTGTFKPISQLQLLALNTGESYPFADRLVEYLAGSTITPIDPISDNIKRAQKVMSQNHHYFKIDGLWEDKMQKIIYDYMLSSGPVELENGALNDKRHGYYPTLGHTSKSTLYDILGYIDREAEKYYASWKIVGDKAEIQDTIQNVDIYVENGKSLWDV